MTLIRTRRNGCFQLRNSSWGTFLCRIDDPDANAEVSKEQLEGFELAAGIAPIPAALWSRWVKLCFHFCKSNSLEVSIRLLRKEDDPAVWRILVPIQGVSEAFVKVDSFDNSMDIETGEIIPTYPPDGWVPAGSSHSHGQMSLDRFSGTDDASELGDPGLHVLLSHINEKQMSYVLTASVTAGGKRFYVSHETIIDSEPINDATFHPDVLKQISIGRQSLSYGVPWFQKRGSQLDGTLYFQEDSVYDKEEARSRWRKRRETIDAFRGGGDEWQAVNAAAAAQLESSESCADSTDVEPEVEDMLFDAIDQLRDMLTTQVMQGYYVDDFLAMLKEMSDEIVNLLIEKDWNDANH